MSIETKQPRIKIFSKVLSDESLTRKATLNAAASTLDYAARLVVAFAVTPITVSFLGNYYYGIWQILTRFITFISPTSGRPSTVLRYTIAHHQSTLDNEQKRSYVGSALAAWVIFLPLVALAGGLFSWYIPYWLNIPPENQWIIRFTAGILVVDLAATGIGAIPQAVLQGLNMGYKRMGLTVAMILLGGGLTWVSLAMGYGIIGVAISTLVSTILSGLLFLNIIKTYAPWFGVVRPTLKDVNNYIGLSWWFVGWDVIFKLMLSVDVIVLGLLNSVESVTGYTLTKYAPEMLITIIAMVVFGVAPGLGGIIGSKDYEKAARIRGEIYTITWLIVATLGTTILIWNRAFLTLWVGPGKYTGTLPMLLILISVIQFVLIRVDSNVIDLTLNIKYKVILGTVSVLVTIAISIFFVKFLRLGVMGILIGMIIGRLLLSIGYPVLVGKALHDPFQAQLRRIVQPALLSIILISIVSILDLPGRINLSPDILGWILFFLFSGMTALFFLLINFLGGLRKYQREQILRRVRLVISVAGR